MYTSPYHHQGGKPVLDNGMTKIGEVTIHFYEDDVKNWYSVLQDLDQRKCRGDLYSVYKLALCMAVVQDTLKQRMGAMDAMLRTNEEMNQIKAELDEQDLTKDGTKGSDSKEYKKLMQGSDTKVVGMSDVEKYQTKLPFEGDVYDSRDNDSRDN